MGDATPFASLCFLLFGLLLLGGLVFGGLWPIPPDEPDDESDWHQMPE